VHSLKHPTMLLVSKVLVFLLSATTCPSPISSFWQILFLLLGSLPASIVHQKTSGCIQPSRLLWALGSVTFKQFHWHPTLIRPIPEFYCQTFSTELGEIFWFNYCQLWICPGGHPLRLLSKDISFLLSFLSQSDMTYLSCKSP
jgi:hypothetical protein